MLKDMQGSVLGVWVAHGEGHAYFPDEKIKVKVLAEGLRLRRMQMMRGTQLKSIPSTQTALLRGSLRSALLTEDILR